MNIDHLFRFRSIHAVLDGFHELENQEIYFSEINELNDPLEGFKNIYWEGDAIVWKNFFRHYILNLLQAIISIYSDEKNFNASILKNFVFTTDEDLDGTKLKDIYKDICENFFQNSTISNLIKFLHFSERKTNREEISFYLQTVHLFTISSILNELEKYEIKLAKDNKQLKNLAIEFLKSIENTINIPIHPIPFTNQIFLSGHHISSELNLIYKFNNPVIKNKYWYFILVNFTNSYLNALEQILYPECYISCFVSNPTDASMWGTYGDSHKGVCLKFKTPERQNKRSLYLYNVVGIGGTKKQNETIYEYQPYHFDKIQYSGKFPEIDFFSSIGHLPTLKLDRFWYRDNDGKFSTKRKEVFDNMENWRKVYWEKYSICYKTKLPEWQHEQEYRLLFHSGMHDFSQKDSRKLKYRFSDLSGIIFGMKTSIEDKTRIIKIIRDKCIKEKRNDFDFFQAYYSTITKKIELHKLLLIKFK